MLFERPGIVRRLPRLYPAIVLLLFIASAVATAMHARVAWLILPIAGWCALGYLAAELAIRRYIAMSREAGRESDRKQAILALNANQGREVLLRRARFPFP